MLHLRKVEFSSLFTWLFVTLQAKSLALYLAKPGHNFMLLFILSAASLNRKPLGLIVHRSQIRDLEGKRTNRGFLDSWDEEHFPLKEITSDKVASLPLQDAS